MRKLSTIGAVLGAAAITLVAISGNADARKKYWNSEGQCQPAIEGLATGTGILGLGSSRARVAARSNWETTAANQYGPGFADLDRARNVQWDCKKGAVLLAKCVVTAQPCSYRIRG